MAIPCSKFVANIQLPLQMFKCPHCPAEYSSKSSLYTHKIKVHGGVGKSNGGDPLSVSPASSSSSGIFNCEVCGKALKGKDSLRDHMLIHDGPR